jgi:PAS domain S-box-containing protein
MNESLPDLGSGILPDFRALFENTPNLYLVLDPLLTIVAVNDAYCRVTMTRREQVVFRNLFEVFPDNPDDVEPTGVGNLRASLQRVLRTAKPDVMPMQKYDIPRPADEGGGFEERYWSPLNAPVLGPRGEVRWIIHRVEDITEFVRMRERGEVSEHLIDELREVNASLAQRNVEIAQLQRELVERNRELDRANRFHNLMLENIPAMVVVKDAKDLRFVFGNRAGDELTGYPRGETVGKTDFDLFPRAQAEAFVAFDRAVLNSRELRVIPEEVISTRHQGDRILRTLKMPVLGEDGEPIYLIAMSEDITERKQAEAALKAGEALLSGILSAVPDAVMVVDEAGKILVASERFRTMYGYGPEELIGKDATMLTPPEKRADNLERASRALRNGLGGVVENLDGLRRDGSEFPVEASLSEHMTIKGRLIIISLRDISDRKAMENQLRQAHKMEAIGNLTGGLAHDFNNLLSVIIGNLDLLREELVDRPGPDGLANEALSAALRGAELTKRLLAFARKQPLQPRRVEVNKLIQGLGKLLSRTMGDNFELRLQLGKDTWPVTVDPQQLENCLVNLATNARDAMPRGGTLTLVTDNRHLDADYVSLHPGLAPGDYTLIEVSDTGSGIEKAISDKIFEPFFTTKKEGKGTGLGLSMVFGFMKQSEGHINVYSEVGVGTTFRLYLPRDQKAAEAAAETRNGPVVTGGVETVLAVEDNPGLRALVVKQLTALGYKCIEAADGPSALKLLEGHDVDLVFTDVVMPGGMSGYDLGREAKTRWPHLRILLTSGFPEEKLNGNGQPPWNMRLLTKPYRKEDLARILREVLAD